VAFPNMRTYSFDANMLLSDNAAAYAATGYAQAFGADGVIDFGGNQGATVTLPAIADVATQTPQQPRIDAYLIADVTAIKISAGNETYKLMLLLSNDPAFALGNVEQAVGVMVGKGTSRDGINMKDSVIGRIELGFTNQVEGNIYQYGKLYLVIAGTAPSISLTAFVSVTPEP
jgi:hypothetical protein